MKKRGLSAIDEYQSQPGRIPRKNGRYELLWLMWRRAMESAHCELRNTCEPWHWISR